MTSFILNNHLFTTNDQPGTVLLDVIRETAQLTGTKEACREGECGACTVLVGTRQENGSVEYKACASCLLPVGDVAGRHVVTVEGLGGHSLTLIQSLIVEHNASQCGFCTPGIVLSLTGFCFASQTFAATDALEALDGNICRCTGYVSIRNAARALAERLSQADHRPEKRLEVLITAGVVPEYFRTIPDRLRDLRVETPTVGKHPVLVAGGTDLFVQKPEQLQESDLCFLSQRRDLSYVREDGQNLHVGGATTIEEFRASEPARKHFPALVHDLLLHSSAILRNKATLSGNIVNASPIGDATIMLLALGARVVISATDGNKRELPLDTFYLGYKKTALACGDLVSEIIIPLLKKGERYHFEKVSNRTTLDIAAVNTALRLTTAPDGTIAGLRLSAGGVGPIPLLLSGLEVFHGRRPDEQFASELAQMAQNAVRPIDDIRGSAEYKKLLLGQLIRAHFQQSVLAKEAV